MDTSGKSNRNTPAVRPDNSTGEAHTVEPAASAPAKTTGHRLWLWAAIPILFIILGLIIDRLRGN